MNSTLFKETNEITHMILMLINNFKAGHKISNTKELVKMATESHMVINEHYKTFKQLYDIAEFAMNIFVHAIQFSNSIENNYALLQNLQDLLPTETERSVDQSVFQQFSTPLTAAYIMSLLAKPVSEDIFIEPSAGTGTLATFIAKSEVKQLILNELHRFRFHLINNSTIYNSNYNEDAIQLHNMPKIIDLGINKAIMNPPFSRNQNTKSKVDIYAGANHVISAYKLLPDNGKIVALMHSNFKSGSKSFNHFLKSTSGVTISVNAPLDPQTFYGKGTTFSTRILVIHKNSTGRISIPMSTLDFPSIKEYQQLDI